MKLLSDGPDLHYVVRLDPDHVSARLSEEVGSEEFPIGSDYVGQVAPRSFQIRRNSAVQNAYRPYLHGRIEPALEGSRVVVRLGLHPTTKVFTVAWLGIMLLIGLVVLVLFLTDNLAVLERSPHPRTILLIPPVMFAGCIAVAWTGRLLGREDETRLLEFADQRWGPRVDPPSE